MEAHHGISERLVRLSRSLPLNVSIIERVVQEKRPLARLVVDLPSSMLRESLFTEGYRLVVSIPLLAQEKVLGAINVVSSLTTTPTDEELAVPEAIGQQIGVAMENARLFKQTVEYAQEMELARQAADKANAAKSEFLANVSHELRTPLVSIFGFARIIQRRLEERIFPLLPAEDGKLEHVREQIDRNLEIILAEGQRLMTMINNLLDLEKIEAGKMEWHFRPVSLAQVLESAAASTAPLFEGKPISLVKDVQPDLPLVEGDFDRLLQVIINLVSNAIEFTTEGEVRVRCQAVDSEVVVEVIDTGTGIAPEDQGRVFEKFNQVGDPLTSKPKGTGLGLAISKEIVERHSGRIWLSSEVGKGSTFAFALPAIRDLEEEEKQPVEDQDG
jgi:signal transduction histidine kinase